MLPSDLPELKGAVALDTETTGLHPDPPECGRVAAVSVAWVAGSGARARVRAVAFPFDMGTRDKIAQAALPFGADPNLGVGQWHALLEWLKRRRLVFHGAKFDLMMMEAGTRQWSGVDLSGQLVWDTMLAERDLSPNEGAELEDLERRYELLDEGGRERWNKLKKRRKGLHKLGWEEVEEYAATDAEVTIGAWDRQVDRYDAGEGSRSWLRRELELTRTLLALERRGLGYDAEKSRAAAVEMRQGEYKVIAQLPFKATIEGARRYFFVTKGAPVGRETATGRPALDDTEVTRLVAAGVEHAAEYEHLRKLQTARTKWYEPYAAATGEDGRIRTVYNQGRVVTGRLSSQRINLQAIPHDYQIPEVARGGWPTPRQLFRAERGHAMWELDLAQAELRVAAKLADCVGMLELLAAGADLHGEVARQLFYDEPGTETWFEHRQVSKRADFALIFDVGPETFQGDLAKHTGIWRPLDDIERIVADWRSLYPEYKRAVYKWHRMADATGWIRLVDGTVRHLALWEDRHKAFSEMVQGSLARFVMRVWLIETEKRWPGTQVLTIHDSLVLEVPLGKRGERIVRENAEAAEEWGTRFFGTPMTVEVKRW